MLGKLQTFLDYLTYYRHKTRKGYANMRKRLISLPILTSYIVLSFGITVNAVSDVVVSSQEYTVYYIIN